MLDPSRLTLPIELLEIVASILPACIGEVSEEGDYRELKNADAVLNLVLNELRRLRDIATPDGNGGVS